MTGLSFQFDMNMNVFRSRTFDRICSTNIIIIIIIPITLVTIIITEQSHLKVV